MATAGTNNPSLAFLQTPPVPTPTGESTSSAPSTLDPNNMTDALAATYLQGLFSANTDATQAPDAQHPLKAPGGDTLSQSIQDATSQGLGVKPFTTQDLQISDDTSSDAQRTYLGATNEILRERFQNGALNFPTALQELVSNQNSDPMLKLLEATAGATGDLLALAVPQPLADFHLRLLNLFRTQQSIYGALMNSDSDPLQAYTAMNQIAPSQQDAVALQTILQEKSTELGL